MSPKLPTLMMGTEVQNSFMPCLRIHPYYDFCVVNIR